MEFNDIEYMNVNKGQFMFHNKSNILHVSRHMGLMLWMESINSELYDSKYEINCLSEKAEEIGKLYNININVSLPSEYLCLHFRGGDKRQVGGMYNCRYNTADVIKEINKENKLPILLVSDDNSEFIRSHNIDIAQLINPSFGITDYTISCIRDLYILQSSRGIVEMKEPLPS